MRVLLTGATGFAGGHILQALLKADIAVRCPVRRALPKHDLLEAPLIDDLLTADWDALCAGVDVVVHAAAYAHDDKADPAMIFRVNRDATAALAKAAAQQGARFIFLSSIRAQAGVASPVPLQDGDLPQPDGPYGQAKLAAEASVALFCQRHVNLRLAPVFGQGVKGNLSTLFNLAKSGVPLPVGRIKAKRSLLSINTLVSIILRILGEPTLSGTYLLADKRAYTIQELVLELRLAWGLPPRVIPMSQQFIKFVCRVIGRPLIWQRIGEQLIVADNTQIRQLFPEAFDAAKDPIAAWAGSSSK
jgi:nucleoside-diphosphate-sugar epimerase